MKPDPDFDDEIRLKFRRLWPARPIWLLMLVVAVSALTMAIVARTVGYKVGAKSGPGPARIAVVKPPVLAIAYQSRDSFVFVADTTIDTKMVVPAPAGIDETMVFNPDARGRLLPLGPGPEFAPASDGASPYFGIPRLR
jgi:hypothetical protein